MLGNTFGRVFRVTTCGESYGAALLTIVDGVPPGLKLTNEMIQEELDKRRPGQSELDSPRKETDKVEIVAGLNQEGYTSGAPVGMVVYNVDRQDIHIQQYRDVKDVIRPGHAEYTFFVKYGGFADWCGAGRASGRETVGRVAAGAVAKQILLREGIEVLGYVKESYGIRAREMTFEEIKANYRKNELNCPDPEAAEKMIEKILEVKAAGDTCGGIVEVIARGVPPGLGEPVFDKLKATIAHGLISIGAVMGVEFGAGFEAARMKGSEFNDTPYIENGKVRFRTNRAGGFLGGISNGEDIVVRIAVKPTPTLSLPQETVNIRTMEPTTLAAITRRDATICPRIYPVAEAMVRIAITDALMMARGYEGLTEKDEIWRRLRE
ncbi:MAG TPA: chorismate synthase [Candidatus Syntrophoarchaeum butanivorans]|uniref:Chorismate synthase n=1 Tax=Candidatus Syntropharchaeum butanivorans TaxID=1839936 RepID=A0A1F2P6V2_9EURY|nr:MAG: chorismate synthase [Candidatus Syntrophoarchaeum butanivorans]HDM35718.1 chorismate synthase [Candidatus Syntrophoarchaeum butanivorans]HEC56705.1 chorismate synthase [Candidatus Syntrophoarchaeum butanivorans]